MPSRILRPWVVVACVVLAACQQPSDLPVEEVLQRSQSAMQNLEAANVEVAVSVNGYPWSANQYVRGSLNGEGYFQNKGQQWKLDGEIEAQLTDEPTDELTGGHLEGEIITMSPQEVYFFLRELNIAQAGDHPSMQLLEPLLVNQWWAIGSAETATSAVTPDPFLLKLQADTIEVTEDYGIVSIEGHDAYRYAIGLNIEEFIRYMRTTSAQGNQEFDEEGWRDLLEDATIDGALWIDRQTYVIARLQWSILANMDGKQTRITFQVDMDTSEDVPRVVPPDSAVPLPLDTIIPQLAPEFTEEPIL